MTRNQTSTLRIPSALRSFAGGERELAVQGETVGQALRGVIARYPSLQPHIFGGDGELRPFVNLYIGEENVRELQGLDTPLQPGDLLRLIPNIAGG